MTKPRQYAGKASGWFIYLFLAAGFHNIIAGWVQAQPVSFVTAKKFSAGSAPTASRVGDFNQDGNRDLAVANSGSNDVSVLAGNGDGTFQTAVNFPVAGSPNSLVVGYFNGDSIQDLAVANSWPNPSISVLLGNGDGTFQPASIVPALPADASVQSIDVGDFNGDHLLDLIVNTNGIAVYLGNGNGTFRAPLITVGTSFFVIGYFNDDGILDIADAHLFGVRVHVGNGDGTFQSPVTSPGVTGLLVVGYFNRDDIADLAVATFDEFNPNVGVLLGNGDGTFRSGGSFSGPFARHRLAVDDFDGDTIADLVNYFPEISR